MRHFLIQHIRGDWRHRPPRSERKARIGEREQSPCVCDGHDVIACDVCGSSAEITPEHTQDSAECWCGGDVVEPTEPTPALRVPIAERLAA